MKDEKTIRVMLSFMKELQACEDYGGSPAYDAGAITMLKWVLEELDE